MTKNISNEAAPPHPNRAARRAAGECGAGMSRRRLLAASMSALLGASSLGIGSAAAAGYP
ncbi:MAG: hypothetical protein GY788_23430 [bacterium]|nr:hypothetical protein [bacterium]